VTAALWWFSHQPLFDDNYQYTYFQTCTGHWRQRRYWRGDLSRIGCRRGSCRRPRQRALGRAETLAAELVSTGGKASAIGTTYRRCQVESAIKALLATGPIQILVNNAGLHHDTLMAGMGCCGTR
jgi:hypothetical protein